MKNTLFFAMAAFVAMGFASCQKGGDDPINFVQGKNARFSISVQMPATRATTVAGTENESAIANISVFIFESNGNLCATGGFTTLALADFTNVGNVYTLPAAKSIATLSGPKRVYVAANLPASLASFSGNESAMLAAFAAVADMSNAGAFTMFSDVAAANLVADDEATPEYEGITTTNLVKVNLDRVVAKVTASTAADIYTITWNDTDAPLQLSYAVEAYRPIQVQQTSFVAPNYWSLGGIAKTYGGAPTVITSDFATEAALSNVMTPNTLAPANIDRPYCFYIGENYPVGAAGDPMALKGNTTYVYITTCVTVNMAATWVDNNTDGDNSMATNPTDGKVVWVVTPDVYGGGISDIFVTSMGGRDYVTDTKERADAIALGLGYVAPNAHDEGIYTYYKGYVHFQVWLNKNGMNDYSIGRNEFIHLKINGILNAPYAFPGYNGDPTDPATPTNPGDPEGPNPQDPKEPVDGAPAWMSVEVTVNPWTYFEQSTELGK